MITKAALIANVEGLSLVGVKENWFQGDFEGVPLALNITANEETAGLLFHVRYPSTEIKDETPEMPEGSRLKELVTNKCGEVTLDRNTGWLSIFAEKELPSVESIKDLLREFIAVAKREGVDLKQRLCMSCRNQVVAEPHMADDRLQLICPACREEGEQKYRRETQLNVTQLPLMIVPSVIGALITAVLWAVIWFGYEWLMGALENVWVPRLLIAVFWFGSGYVVAKPLTFFLSRVRNRGVHFAGMFALVCCAAALVLGELMFVGAICLKVLGVLPGPDVLASIWLSLFRDMPILYILGKAFAVVTALWMAYREAMPRRKAL